MDNLEIRPARLVKELYFPTQIYFKDLSNAVELNKGLIREIHQWREADQDGIVRSNASELGAWHSALDMHRRPEYRGLTIQLFRMMDEIFDDLGYDPTFEPVCDNMWANINPPHGYNRTHTHANVLWSGVYYVKTPENCGRIVFYDPRAQAHVIEARFDPARQRNAEVWAEVFFEPVAGRLVMFPAWLLHDVRPNESDLEDTEGERISVSFNFFQRLREGARLQTPTGHDSRGFLLRSQLDNDEGADSDEDDDGGRSDP